MNRLLPRLVTLCLLVALSLTARPAAAQPADTGGLVIGQSMTQLRGAEGFSEVQYGPVIGLTGTLRLTSILGLRASVLYMEKGGSGSQPNANYTNLEDGESEPIFVEGVNYDGRTANVQINRLDFNDLGVDVRLTVDYLEVPVLLDVYPPVDWAVRPRFSIGPFVSYTMARLIDPSFSGNPEVTMLTGTVFFDNGEAPLLEYEDPETLEKNPAALGLLGGEDLVLAQDEVISNLDYGVVFGAGVEFDVRGQPVAIGLSYDLGLADITQEPEGAPPIVDLSDAEARTSALTLSVEVRFQR